jgi:hypothetical protein
MYPNPVKNDVNISCDGIIETVELYDIQGRMLHTEIVNENVAKFDLSDKAKGIYFIRVTTNIGQKVEKIIKQ